MTFRPACSRRSIRPWYAGRAAGRNCHSPPLESRKIVLKFREARIPGTTITGSVIDGDGLGTISIH